MRKTFMTMLVSSICLIMFCQEKDHIVLLESTNQKFNFKTNEKMLIAEVDSAKLKKVIQKYKAETFFKCVSNAKKENLSNLYEMHINGDIEKFKSEINSTGEFKFLRELEIEEIESCSNPFPDVNDTWMGGSNGALDLIEANCAWSITTGNSGIVVGIADTEFKDHPDLRNQLVNISGPITDQHPHGLYVSGCCSPQTNNNTGIAGIGYNTKIAGYRVAHTMDAKRSASGSPYSAIMQAWNDGRQIINVSWTGTGLTIAEATNITNSGTVLVLAAGNSPTSTNHSSIANIPGVIVVSSVNNNNIHEGNHAHNQWVDLCSPGINVTTLEDPDSSQLYRGVWGTSSSAPYVAGTIGLMLSVNHCLTPATIELVLEANCDPISNANDYPGLLGAGRLNSYKAVLGAIDDGTNRVDNLTLTNTQNFNGLYVASENTKINNGANITFTYEKDVTLEPGFEVAIGGQFTTQQATYTCE